MHLKSTVLLCVLSAALLTANASTESTELNDEDSTDSAMMMVVESTTEEMSAKSDAVKEKPAKTTVSFGEEEEGDDNDEGEEEEGCDLRLSSVVRNIDGTPFMPDDYEEAYESVTKTDFVNKKYNITDMMSWIQGMVDYGTKMSKNKDLADTGMYVSSVMMDRIYDAKVSAECTADLANIAQSLRNGQLWGAKFIDSMAMVPSGMMTGHISALGEYDQCLGIKSPVLENGRRIYGQYCSMQARSIIPKTITSSNHTESVFRSNPYIRQALELFGTQANMANFLDDETYVVRILKEFLDWIDKDVCFFHAAICVPSTCSPEELEVVINQVLFPIMKLPFRVAYCEKHPDVTETKLDNVQWLSIIVLAAVSTLAVISTLFHLYLIFVRDPQTVKKALLLSEKNNHGTSSKNTSSSGVNLCLNLEGHRAELQPARSICQQFAIIFSVVHNTKKLLSPEKTTASSLVHSLQLLFTFFLSATYAFSFGLLVTPQLLRNWVNSIPYDLISSDLYWFARMPSIWVDGLMFITGVSIILRQFALLRSKATTGSSFGYFGYVWSNWYRLSVPMFSALLIIYLMPLAGNGPFYYIIRNWLWPTCTKTSSLVSSFLYYSNWNPTFIDYKIKDEFSVCNPPTWYFSASMQLYMLAPVVFLPLFNRPKLGITLVVVLLLLSPLSTLAPYLASGQPTFLELTSHTSLSGMYGAFHQYTSNTLQYVTSLLIGLLTGYLIEKKPNAAFGGKAMQALGFSLSLVVIVLVFVWGNTFWVFNQNNSTTLALAWYVSSKFLFTGAFACITYICATGRIEILNPLLRIVEPIGKLSTSILMVSVLTILYRLTTPRHTYEMHFFQTLQNAIVDFVIATFFAYLLHLLFEGPAIRFSEIFENDQLFHGRQGTDSVEELKPKNSRSSSEDSVKKSDLSIDKMESTPKIHESELA